MALAGLVALLHGVPAIATPQLAASPSSGVFDEPITVRVTGAEPGVAVVIRASFTDQRGHEWFAEGQYFASAQGAVDTGSDVSVGGSFTGAGAAQLLCSVLPVRAEQLAAHISELSTAEEALISPAFVDSRPVEIKLQALIDGAPLPPVSAVRGYAAPDVVQQEIETSEVKGVFYTPRARQAGRAVLVIGGSGGGVPWQSAAMLASRGHAALALAYFAYGDLPADLVEVPLERFAAASRWLRQRTSARRIAVLGASRGSEAAQLVAVHFPEGIDRVILSAPSHLVHGGFGMTVKGPKAAWTLRGKPVPFAPTGAAGAASMRAYREQSTRAPGFVGTPYYLQAWNSPEVADAYGIPVERIGGRVLAIAGAADTMWPSWIGAERIRERMIAEGRGGHIETVLLAGAGHIVSLPPFANAMSGFVIHPVTKGFVSVGGTPAHNCAAKFIAWRRILEFIR